MSKRPGPSRKDRREQAESLLLGLLKTPKTRAGLIASVESMGVSRNFVFGFLSEKTRSGVVTMHKSTNPVKYQATAFTVSETPAEGVYPAWLEPRALPTAVARRIIIDGKPSGVLESNP